MTTLRRHVAGFACNTRLLFYLLALLLTGLAGLAASPSSATMTGPAFTYDLVTHSAQATATSAPAAEVLAGSHAQARAPSRGTPLLQSNAVVAAEAEVPAFARSQYGRVSAGDRAAALEKSPTCPYCGKAPSTQADHISSVKQDWTNGGWADDAGSRTARVNDPDKPGRCVPAL